MELKIVKEFYDDGKKGKGLTFFAEKNILPRIMIADGGLNRIQ